MTRLWRLALAERGIERFMLDDVVPFLHALGAAWAAGTVTVFEEHHASELLTELLAGLWHPLADEGAGPRIALATLPGELHIFGLRIAACLAVQGGWRVTFLGRDTPIPESLTACDRARPRALLLSLSLSLSACANLGQASWDLATLRERLPGETRLVVGGAGVPQPLPAGVENPGFPDLPAWLRDALRP